MAIDPRYIAALDLQQELLDKDSGFNLAGGFVYFWRQSNLAEPKAVYELVGTNFVALPNPVQLSDIGTFADNNGNDIIPYYLPLFVDYTSSPPAITTIQDLYYVTVYNSAGVFQFSRSYWPPNSSEGGNGSISNGATNFVPNPQFLAHNNLNPTQSIPGGITEIAQGGWEFILPSMPFSTNTLNFYQFPSWVASPPESPPFAVNVICTNPNTGDNVKNLRLKFNDVNKFTDGNAYQFGFFANTVSQINVNVNLVKNFGSGGSAQTSVTLTTATLLPGADYGFYTVEVPFGTNAGDTIGTGETFVAIDIAFPLNVSFNATFTDFMLIETGATLTASDYPPQTNADTLTRSVAGWMDIPDYDGFDLYLPLVATPYGTTWDNSQIGLVYASLKPGLSKGELLCDGSTYFTNQYSSDGIPYARLQSILWNNGSYNQFPLFGTGSEFVSAYSSATTALVNFAYNQAGASTPVDPTDPGTTGFTITTVNPGGATQPPLFIGRTSATTSFVRYNALNTGSDNITFTGSGSAITATLTNYVANTHTEISLSIGAPANFSSGNVLTFTFPDASTAAIYFKVNGVGSPSVGQLVVDVLSTDSAAGVSAKILTTLTNGWSSEVVCVAGNVIPNNAYLTFAANSIVYKVQYIVSPNLPPNPIPSTTIIVNILTTDNANDVAVKTILAINQFAFAVPDLEGQFLRGVDNSAVWDASAAGRAGFGSPIWYGPGPGTWEVDQFASHNHTVTPSAFGVTSGNSWPVPGGALTTTAALSTGFTGSEENRPINVSVNWIIKY